MKELVDALRETLSYLGWEEKRKRLDTRWENHEDGNYFVSFVGQYSAGKSFLLNNLLGRRVLPQGITETTPLLTYIQYGERERAVLCYLDGKEREVSIEEVAEIVQNSVKWDVENLERMHIFLDDAMLRDGMVLMDTPGINTVIQRHEDLLNISLLKSERIIYVIGHAPSRVDATMLGQLQDQGFELAVVRTHCDEIRSSEENAEETIKEERILLEKWGVPADRCYHVSNVDTSLWYGNIQGIRDMIAEIGASAKEESDHATAAYLERTRNECLEALSEQHTILLEKKSGNEKCIEEKLSQIEQRMHSLEELVRVRQEKLEKEIRSFMDTLNGPVTRQAQECLENSVSRVVEAGRQLCNTQNPEKQMAQRMETEAVRFVREVTEEIGQSLNHLLYGINTEIELEDISLDSDVVPKYETYGDLSFGQNVELLELKENLSSIRNRREDIECILQAMEESPDYLKMVQKVKALDQEILTLEKEYRDFPPYVPRVIETDDGRPQPSDVAREVGNLVDWALLLLPGSAINKGLSFLSKGKGVKKVADIIGATGNARKVIDVGDKIKDAAFMARSIGMTAEGKNALRGQHQGDEMRCFDLSNQSGKTDKFSLDWLTVQHWAAQIASNFDRPPVLSVDKEYEGQYMKEKRRLERQIIEEQRCSHLQKCELRLYKDEKDKRDAERKALIADEKRLGEELRIREQEIRKNAERSAYENWVLQCSTSYRAKAEQKLNEMLAQYRNVIPGRLQQYQETRLQGLRKKLENEEMSYRNISEAGDDAIEQEIIKIGALMQGLRSVEV